MATRKTPGIDPETNKGDGPEKNVADKARKVVSSHVPSSKKASLTPQSSTPSSSTSIDSKRGPGRPRGTTKNADGQPMSSSERSRKFRDDIKKGGGETIAIGFDHLEVLGIEVIRDIHKTKYKTKAVRAAVISEARRLCPTEERARQLMERGVLSEEVGNQWIDALRNIKKVGELVVLQLLDAEIKASVKKEKKKPIDLRLSRSGVKPK